MTGPSYSPIELLARLVSFDTTSSKSNMDLVRFVEDYLAGHGIASRLVPTPDGEKASLFASLGPQRDGGIGLSGHTDVVPADPAAWSASPYELVERGSRLYGRGTTDMKGYLACVLAMVPEWKRRNLKVPIHILFSYDEETGCTGVRPMIAELGKTLPKPRIVFVGEPTNMAVVDAHKGPVRWAVEITGRAAHSSMPHVGVNAISYAARLIRELESIEADLKALPPNPRFDPAYPTLQITEITGGIASNIVPPICRFGFEVRALPGLDIDALDRRIRDFIERECHTDMRSLAPEAAITLRQTNRVPPFAADEGSDAVALALALAKQNDTRAVSYATEAGLFQNGGCATVVCGPGDIAQAHTADEWIEKSELDACMAFMRRLADWSENQG